MADAAPRIIDTHHHIYPPNYTKTNLERLVNDSVALPASAYTSWTPGTSIEAMEKAGIETAISSITSPGIWFGDGVEKARARARECNEFGAGMARDFPKRFGMFAAIPLPDIEGSLREIEYALDTLKLDGIGLMTSYETRLLGDPGFLPVFQELNRRNAAVFVHPTMSCGNLFPGIAGPQIEFPTDTARTVTSLILGGTAGACPNVKFIFSHGGGTLAMVVQRFARIAARLTPEERQARMPNGFEAEIRRQYYDLASIGSAPIGMAAVLKMLPVSQLTYGSDAPFGSSVEIANGITRLELSEADKAAIRRGNALRLFPRYA
ncbi:MAG TPA: amidohydrolase family protein [Stellaceae bacterium]|nr:amidohydrolase family protein [Stellaceae bacterium]